MKREQNAHHWLHEQLDHWQKQGWITAQGAEQLRQHHPLVSRSNGQPSPLTIILGVFGSLLIASGIILVFATNWDDLSRGVRTLLAVAPLILFQGLGGWTLWRRPDSLAWRESTAAGIIVSIGTAIALIAQTYQLGGDFGRFMLTWTLLAVPVVYLLRSTVGAALALAGAALYAGYLQDAYGQGYAALALGALLVPACALEIRRGERGFRAGASRLILAVGGWALLATSHDYGWPGLWMASFGGFASVLLLWGAHGSEAGTERTAGPLHPFGLTAAIYIGSMLCVFSFEDTWRAFGSAGVVSAHSSSALGPAGVLAVLAVAWSLGLVRARRAGHYRRMAFAASVLLWSLGGLVWGLDRAHPWPLMLATNAYGVALAVGCLVTAVRRDSLALLNYGLLLLSALILLRFFDSGIGLLPRGLAFIGLGTAFLGANLIFVRRRTASPVPR